MSRAVIITGVNGGIGSALKKRFESAGYKIIGIGLGRDCVGCAEYVEINFFDLVNDSLLREKFEVAVRSLVSRFKVTCLINNAAEQILAEFSDLEVDDFRRSLDVNLVVPFFLSKLCLSSLKENRGSIINIGSVHSRLTKKKFVAYSTAKGGLESLTKAMAVEIGSQVRVNAISPAAIETEMLLQGFLGKEHLYEKLKSHHPSRVLGSVSEVSELALFLAESSGGFLNGSVVDLSGGISSVLHDPDGI